MDAQEFLKTIKFFGEPKIPAESDRDTIMDSYFRVLGRYDGEVLKLASEMMLDTRGHRNFPLPEECAKWCQDAREEIAFRRKREATAAAKADKSWAAKEAESKPSDDPWSTYRIRKADRMMDSDVGRRAAEEGWIIALHDFCREQARLPSPQEASKVRLEAMANKAIRDRLVDHPNYKQGIKLIGHVARAMENKRERLSKIALNAR